MLQYTFWLTLGDTYDKIGQYEAAISAYKQAVELAPERANCYLQLARCFMHIQDYEQAISTCELGLKATQQELLGAEKSRIEKEYIESKYGTFSS